MVRFQPGARLFLLLSSVMCHVAAPLRRCSISVFPFKNEYLAVQLGAKKAEFAQLVFKKNLSVSQMQNADSLKIDPIVVSDEPKIEPFPRRA